MKEAHVNSQHRSHGAAAAEESTDLGAGAEKEVQHYALYQWTQTVTSATDRKRVRVRRWKVEGGSVTR